MPDYANYYLSTSLKISVNHFDQQGIFNFQLILQNPLYFVLKW